MMAFPRRISPSKSDNYHKPELHVALSVGAYYLVLMMLVWRLHLGDMIKRDQDTANSDRIDQELSSDLVVDSLCEMEKGHRIQDDAAALEVVAG
jgi:hypothetical protein